LGIEAILKEACTCQAIKWQFELAHVQNHITFAREKGCLKWIRSIMGQKQSLLTSQQKT
jgi:hypothetical protein